MAPSDDFEEQRKFRMSSVSDKYDIGHKGYLTEAEEAVRELDYDNKGTITTEHAVQIMEHTMELQEANRSLHRWVYTLLSMVLISGAATVGCSLAAARLAKDTKVDGTSGIMTVKDDDTQAVVTVSKGNLDNYALEMRANGDRAACIDVSRLNSIMTEVSEGMPTNLMLEDVPAPGDLSGNLDILGLQAAGSTSNRDGACYGVEQGGQLCYDFGDFCDDGNSPVILGRDDSANDVFSPGNGRRRRTTATSRRRLTPHEWKDTHRHFFYQAVILGKDVHYHIHEPARRRQLKLDQREYRQQHWTRKLVDPRSYLEPHRWLQNNDVQLVNLFFRIVCEARRKIDGIVQDDPFGGDISITSYQFGLFEDPTAPPDAMIGEFVGTIPGEGLTVPNGLAVPETSSVVEYGLMFDTDTQEFVKYTWSIGGLCPSEEVTAEDGTVSTVASDFMVCEWGVREEANRNYVTITESTTDCTGTGQFKMDVEAEIIETVAEEDEDLLTGRKASAAWRGDLTALRGSG